MKSHADALIFCKANIIRFANIVPAAGSLQAMKKGVVIIMEMEAF